MTVTTSQHTVIAQGTGSSFTFGYPTLDIYSNAELLVLHVDENVDPEVITILAEGTGAANYAVTPNAPYSEGKTDGFIASPTCCKRTPSATWASSSPRTSRPPWTSSRTRSSTCRNNSTGA